MKAILIFAAGIAAIAVGTPASAHHLENLDTPYASRGECESTVARFNQVEDVTDAERDEAWKRIEAAAKKYDVELEERSWHDLKKPKA